MRQSPRGIQTYSRSFSSRFRTKSAVDSELKTNILNSSWSLVTWNNITILGPIYEYKEKYFQSVRNYVGSWDFQFRSVQFSHSVMSDSLRPHGLQHARPPCPSPISEVYSNSCPLSRWYHPTISSSIVPLCSHLQSFPELESFQMSQFFASGGQSIGVSASASVFPMNIQDWFPLGWTGWISLQSKGLSRVFSNTTVQKHQFFCVQHSL